jgi:hypothetical protein
MLPKPCVSQPHLTILMSGCRSLQSGLHLVESLSGLFCKTMAAPGEGLAFKREIQTVFSEKY